MHVQTVLRGWRRWRSIWAQFHSNLSETADITTPLRSVNACTEMHGVVSWLCLFGIPIVYIVQRSRVEGCNTIRPQHAALGMTWITYRTRSSYPAAAQIGANPTSPFGPIVVCCHSWTYYDNFIQGAASYPLYTVFGPYTGNVQLSCIVEASFLA